MMITSQTNIHLHTSGMGTVSPSQFLSNPPLEETRRKKAKQKEAEAISLDADQTATQQDEIQLTFCSVFSICA